MVPQKLIALLGVLVAGVAAHPWCLSNTSPWTDGGMQFCKASSDGKTCCSRADEDAIKNAFYGKVGNASQTCKDLYQQYVCGKCASYASHLFADTGRLMLKGYWCSNLYNACKDSLHLASDFCSQNTHNPDNDYSYPFTPPNLSTGDSGGGGTALTNAFPKVALPTWMIGMYMKPNSNSWWIVSKLGRIYQMENSYSTTYTTTVLDISSRVKSSNNEQGLLGLAFAPNFQSTGAFYVHYINYDNGNNGHTVLSRFIYKSGDKTGTGNSEYKLLQFDQPFSNHNGGFLGFKPSSMRDNKYASADTHFSLYWSLGDGGDHDDPGSRSGNINTYFGKILKLSVSAYGGYSYPTDNPYYPATGVKGLVWAYGLRNPWRCTHDSATDDLWCGDVGQEHREEVSKVIKGKNHGWKYYEGNLCNPHYNQCAWPDNYQPPVADYCHDSCGGYTGECIIGGYMYRGSMCPSLKGTYIFADYMKGTLGMIRPGKNYVETFKGTGVPQGITSFGQDNSGELYVIAEGRNQIFRVGC